MIDIARENKFFFNLRGAFATKQLKKILLSRNSFTLRKLTHLKAKFRFFLPLPRNPRFPAMEAWVEFEFELLTVESLSLSSSSNFVCFPPRSCSASDPVASHSI